MEHSLYTGQRGIAWCHDIGQMHSASIGSQYIGVSYGPLNCYHHFYIVDC